MKNKKILLSLAAVLLILAGCKSEYDVLLEGNDVEAKYAAAFDYFNQGKYSKSSQLFESLSFATGGTPREDTVLYYWGLSNYRFRDFYTAETNFQNFIENFPRSPFAENARFLYIDCLFSETLRYELDQTPTNKAIAAIAEYMVEYPESPHYEVCDNMLKELSNRLDRKAYEAAKLYYHMEDYLAARVALKNILKDDAENIYREDILYYSAMSSYKYAYLSVTEKQKERYLVFLDDYLNFISEYPDSSYARELGVLNKRAQRALGRYVADEENENF